jgi:serine/threonine-protein kinase
MPYTPGDTLLDKYKIEALIGQGAFGDVYRVTHIALRSPRAIKLLRRDASGTGSTLYKDTQQRFQLEAQLGARLQTPHLLQVHDLTLGEDLLILEMEYASGGNLSERLLRQQASQTPFALSEALQIAEEIALGLSALHAIDIVHRDLKPANILFDEHGHARLADLGLAQMPHGPSNRSQLSEAQPHPGTPGYMSPEQRQSTDILTSPSDIYALGLVLFEILTGRNYTFLKPGTRAQTLRGEIPPQLDELLAKMLSKTPEERPWDGMEASELLKNARVALQDQPPETTEDREITELKARAASAEKALAIEKALILETERKAEQARQLAEQKARLKAEAEAVEKELAAQKALREEIERKAEQVRQQAAEKARLEQEAERKRRELFLELAPGVTMEFVRVPAGEFLMGSDKQKDKQAQVYELPQHKVMLNEYLIGKAPVTNQQFEAFAQATGYKKPAYWQGGEIPQGKQDHPVVSINWNDALAFCAWVSKSCGQKVRLPTEAEWEKAARGTDARIYPWGDQSPDANRCNYYGTVRDTTPVGKYSPQGDSPYGCVDMPGNVWEWVNDWYGPYSSASASNPTGPASGDGRVLRGGSWSDIDSNLRVSYRVRFTPDYRNYNYGFRCSR